MCGALSAPLYANAPLQQSAFGRRTRALVIEQAAQTFDLLRRELSEIDGEVGSDRHAALHRRACADLFEPALEIAELVDVLALLFPAARPRAGAHLRDRILVAGDEAAIVQPVVEHAVQAIDLVGEAAHRVGLVPLRVAEAAKGARSPGLPPLF